MKRYLAFACVEYYPAGGLDDMVGDFDTPEEAVAAIKAARPEWGHYLDTENGCRTEVDITSQDIKAWKSRLNEAWFAEALYSDFGSLGYKGSTVVPYAPQDDDKKD